MWATRFGGCIDKVKTTTYIPTPIFGVTWGTSQNKYRNNKLFHKFHELAINIVIGLCETNFEHSSPHGYDKEDQSKDNDSMPKKKEIPPSS